MGFLATQITCAAKISHYQQRLVCAPVAANSKTHPHLRIHQGYIRGSAEKQSPNEVAHLAVLLSADTNQLALP